MEALRLEQGTSEWLEHRRTRGTASETAALMSCAPWFPRTPYELWTVKTGRAEVPENPAMRRGAALERQARELAEQVLGEPFMPHVFERDRMIASLDGISFCGTRGLEIKCPVKGAESDVWQAVEAGAPPAHYMWQAQAQILIAGLKRVTFAVYDEPTHSLAFCDVLPDLQMHEAIKAAWAQFFEHLDADTPPPLTDRDVRERTDAEWRDAVAAWKEAKARLDEASKAEKAARETLIQLAGEQSSQGAGVRVTRFWRSGSTDYAKAAKDAGLDLSKYERPGNWQYRITEQSE